MGPARCSPFGPRPSRVITMSRTRWLFPVFVALFAGLTLVPSASAQGLSASVVAELPQGLCPPDWATVFGGQPGVGGGSSSNSIVLCSAVFDDGLGDGPVLFIGGDFATAGGRPARNIARWDGNEWSEPGGGVNQRVYAMDIHDDGTGLALYIGGDFTLAGGAPAAHLARWNGTSFSTIGAGVNGTVHALRRIIDGTVEYMAVGGTFTTADGNPASRIALYFGAVLIPFGDGFDGQVNDVVLYDNAIYAGGDFDNSGATPLNNLARWNGSQWLDVDSGTDGRVMTLEAIPSGAMQGLYVGGDFDEFGPGPIASPSIARWQGGTWSALGPGIAPNVRDLVVWDDGGGIDLYVAGHIDYIGGYVGDQHVIRWDGAAWTTVGIGTNERAFTLAVHDDGSGESLWVGGEFTVAGLKGCNGIGRWDGANWSPVGGVGLNDNVYDLHVSSALGGGPSLFVAGEFAVPGTSQDRGVAMWSGGAWTALGAIQDDFSEVRAVAVFDDGSGPALFAGGTFSSIGGVSAQRIAKWDGSSWSSLGSGLDGWCFSLEVWNDGTGPALYAAGGFSTANGVPAEGIARWDGSTFSALADGLSTSLVKDMRAFNDGSGPALYAAGNFDFSGALAVNGIAKWDGSAWSALGSGLTTGGGSFPGFGSALEVFDDGFGPALYVGGNFTAAGGVPDTVRLARWDGSNWSGMPGPIEGVVESLAAYDDSTGKSLFVGGNFAEIDDVSYPGIARWDGAAWNNLGLGVNGGVFAMQVWDEGNGPQLTVGGAFTSVPDLVPVGASHLASWEGCWGGVNNWVDLGFATSGTFGPPLLQGEGSLTCGSINEVNLSNAFPGALSGLFISLASTPTPFAGGTLIPVPWLDPIVLVNATVSGDIPLSFVMPPGVPAGTDIFVQWAIQDPGPSSGLALSNALRGDVP